MTYITDDINKGHTVYFKSSWTDPEPDTFRMSLESAQTHSKPHVVMSGCATWLTLEQAKEVYVELARYIDYMERREIRDKKITERKKIRKESNEL